MKCPVCGRESWRTTIAGTGFHIEECSAGCIRRTVPPPKYCPDLPDGASAENLDDKDSGHFRIAGEILDVVGGVQPSGKLLDIGSGWGQLLKLAGDRGYDAMGLEASPGAADISRQAFGANVIEGSFPEYRFEPCAFEDPLAALSEAQRILKPDGILAVCVPNFNSVMSQVKCKRWQGLQPSQHVWQLSVRSVCRLTNAAGLTPVAVRHRQLDYPHGPRSLPKWIVWLAVLTTARLSRLGDNVIVLAGKAE